MRSLTQHLGKASRLALGLWLCLFSLAHVSSFPDMVLCFGEDEHLAFELAVDDKCGDGHEHEQATDNEKAFNSVGDAHCGDCSDVPLISDSFRSSATRHLSQAHDAGFDFTGLGLTVHFMLPRVEGESRLPSAACVFSQPLQALAHFRTIRILV